jgi:hypothetical protein
MEESEDDVFPFPSATLAARYNGRISGVQPCGSHALGGKSIDHARLYAPVPLVVIDVLLGRARVLSQLLTHREQIRLVFLYQHQHVGVA